MIDTTQVVTFTLDYERYGVLVDHVFSVEPYMKISRVPRTPAFVSGIVNLRGSIVPVVDLRERFGFLQQLPTEESRLVVIHVDGMRVALLVDAVEDVVTIDENSMEPAPSVAGGVDALFIDGVYRSEERPLILLNLMRVLSLDGNEEFKDSVLGAVE